MRLFYSFTLVLFYLLFSASAQAATYWVHPTGSLGTTGTCVNTTTPQGSGGNARTTIAAGIACMSGGDTLNIRAGTYAEGITDSQLVGKSGTGSGNNYTSPTTIRAYGTEVVTITGGIGFNAPAGVNTSYVIFQGDQTAKNFVLDGYGLQVGQAGNTGLAHHIKFDGMQIKNVPGGPPSPSVATTGEAANSDIWFTHMHIYNSGSPSDGCNTGGPAPHGFYIQSPNNIIENTEIDHVQGYGLHNYDQNSGSGHDNIYRNNYVHHNGLTQPPGCQQTVFGVGIVTGTGNQVYNNIVVNNSGGMQLQSPGVIGYNNTVYGNTNSFAWCCYEAIYAPAASKATIRNNIVYNNQLNTINNTGGTGTCGNNGNLCADPSFTNAAGGNFTLQAGSAASDLGANLGATFSPDYAGNARPGSGPWEAGVYELITGPAPTDDFARANGALGSNWLSGYSGIITPGTIVSQAVQGTAINTNSGQTWHTAATSDHAGSVTIAAYSDNGDIAILLRASAPPTSTFYYIGASLGNPFSTYIYRCEAGSCTNPAQDNSVTWAQGDTLKASAVGGTISVYRNGSLVFTYTDPTPLTGNYVGFGSYASSDVSSMKADNFLIESLGGTAPAVSTRVVKIQSGQTLKLGLQ